MGVSQQAGEQERSSIPIDGTAERWSSPSAWCGPFLLLPKDAEYVEMWKGE